MANTSKTVIIDDGTREFTMTNSYGQVIGKVHFRPADFSIIDRFNDLMKGFDAIVEPLKDLTLKNDGTAAFEEDWEKVKKVETDLKTKIGELFDLDDVEAIFAKRTAFSSVGGNFYVFNVLTALQGVVEEAVEEEAKLSTDRMSKYLNDIESNAGAASTGA